MFLSRIPLDISNRNTLKALSSPSKFHGALENCFTGERKRNLWRLDNLNGKLYFLVLTETAPDFSSFCQQFSQDEIWETKFYDNFLQKIENNSKWRFRITANPTVSICSNIKEKRGKVYPHITTEYQKKWLIEKSKNFGFCLVSDAFDVVQNKWYRFYKSNNHYISLLAVTYEGFLTVNDAELFRNNLIHGIGKGKAYGMGLMTIM